DRVAHVDLERFHLGPVRLVADPGDAGLVQHHLVGDVLVQDVAPAQLHDPDVAVAPDDLLDVRELRVERLVGLELEAHHAAALGIEHDVVEERGRVALAVFLQARADLVVVAALGGVFAGDMAQSVAAEDLAVAHHLGVGAQQVQQHGAARARGTADQELVLPQVHSSSRHEKTAAWYRSNPRVNVRASSTARPKDAFPPMKKALLLAAAIAATLAACNQSPAPGPSQGTSDAAASGAPDTGPADAAPAEDAKARV